jgi:hypothetical protein
MEFHSHPDLTRVPDPDGPKLGRRASRAFARFLVIFLIGGGAALAWQAYGDAARAMLASSSPQLGWLAPVTAPVAQTTPDVVAPPAAETTASPDLQQFAAALTSVRQGVDQLAAQLAAGQRQVADDISKLQADEQKILRKLSAAASGVAAAPATAPRKLAPVTAPPSPSAQAR